MKRNYIVLASALLISAGSFAQKDQFKAAEKAMKSGSPAVALSTLAEAESLLSTEDDKAQYNFIKGNAHLDLAKKNVEPSKNYAAAAQAYQTLFEIEKKTGKSKYSKQAEASQLLIFSGLKNDAYKDYTNKNFKEAAEKYYNLYNLDKKEADYLYNASNAAILSQDYDLALPYLKELQSINYSGEGTNYVAVSKLTGKEEFFLTKKDRDNAVTLGTHEKPTEEKVKSKQPEIAKNVALILLAKGTLDEQTKQAIASAKQLNPDDSSIPMNEANLYLKNNDTETYKRLISEILDKNPTNVDLIYNLGVISYTNKDLAGAEKFYARALEINPNYANAHYNMAAVKIDQAGILLDQMSKLGTSAADNKKYDALKKQRDELLVSIMGSLEKTMSLDDKNIDAKIALVSVYNALEMTAKAKALKEKVKEQEGKQ